MGAIVQIFRCFGQILGVPGQILGANFDVRRSSSSCALRYIDSFCSSSYIVATPSDAKWVQLAKKVAAGTASDDEVYSFQLHFAVLKKLPSDFVATAYENAAHAYIPRHV